MHYYIDAYNLFFALYPLDSPSKEKRQNFLLFIEEAFTKRGKLSLVFDNLSKEAHLFPQRKHIGKIEVIDVPKGETADSFLIEMVKHTPKKITVVSSDKKLLLEIKALGAQTITSEEFIETSLSKTKNKSSIEKPSDTCKEEKKRWIELFKKRSDR